MSLKSKIKAPQVATQTQETVIVGDDTTTNQACPVNTQPADTLEAIDVFPTLIYKTNKPEYFKDVRQVANESLNKLRKDQKLNDIYPVLMSEHLDGDPRMMPFANYVAQTAWNILDAQGYDVQNYNTYFTELWCQEHHKHSLMEEHIHPYGVHIVGMYFLEVPKDSPRMIVHDPRPAKAVLNLPEKNVTNLTPGSVMVNFEPKVGDLFFAPAWLAHSFGRHAGSKPFKFIHFNVGLRPVNNYVPTTMTDPNRNSAPLSTQPAEII